MFNMIRAYRPISRAILKVTPQKSLIYRNFTTTQVKCDGGGKRGEITGEKITIHFIDSKGEKKTVEAPIGENVMNVAHDNNIDLEGACEGSLACSTCHVYVHEDYFDKIPEPVEEEEDMLDLAYGLTEMSRLGCQIELTKDLEGMTVVLPKFTRNMQVDKK
ncbi:2Fe-2S ferredoxin [Acrasis kona]|uniref:2Fe-2S ferredoxin n=1 Tax=Acrasis kona TaxID=1008807 RepID=A0AAW2Z649_9EUKA